MPAATSKIADMISQTAQPNVVPLNPEEMTDVTAVDFIGRRGADRGIDR